jgi:hypothetical protein
MRLKIFVLITSLFLSQAANALEEAVYSTETFNETFIFPNINTFAPAPEGGVAWDLFAASSEVPEYDHNQHISSISVLFSEFLKPYDGQIIKMNGYIFPLESTPEQSKFLFGPFPVTCFYHFHTPPVLVIEAHAKDPQKFSYDLLTIQGRLELVKNASREPYYRLHNTQIISESKSLIINDKPAKKSWHPLFHKRVQNP